MNLKKDNSYLREKIIKKYEHKLNRIENKIKKINSKKEKDNLDQYNEGKLEINKKCILHILDSYKNKPLNEANIEKSLTSEKRRRYLILNGNILSTVIMICIPLAIYAFFNSCSNLIDQLMAAQITETSVSNVAVISQIKNAVSAFGLGIAGGGAVLVSRYYGQGDLKSARKTASNMFLISLIVSVIILIVLIPLAYPILTIAQAPTINSSVITYYILCMVELMIIAMNNIFIGLEKVKGNSRKILILNIGFMIIKLLFNILFVFGLSVDSIAYLEVSSILGQLFLLIIGINILFGKKNLLQISFKDMKPKKLYIVPIIKLSLPIFFGKFVMSLGKVTVNSLCGSYYSTETDGLIVGALGISNNLTGLVTSTTGVFEEGQSTIVSQNIGNSNLNRTIKTFYSSLLVVAIICITGFVLVKFVFLDQLTDIFGKTKSTTSSELPTYVKQIFYYDCWSIPALGITSCLLGILYGYGKTFLSSILNFSRIGIRIVVLIIFHAVGMNYQAAGLSMGISNILIAVLSFICLVVFFISLKKHGYLGMKLEKNKKIEKVSFDAYIK